MKINYQKYNLESQNEQINAMQGKILDMDKTIGDLIYKNEELRQKYFNADSARLKLEGVLDALKSALAGFFIGGGKTMKNISDEEEHTNLVTDVYSRLPVTNKNPLLQTLLGRAELDNLIAHDELNSLHEQYLGERLK